MVRISIYITYSIQACLVALSFGIFGMPTSFAAGSSSHQNNLANDIGCRDRVIVAPPATKDPVLGEYIANQVVDQIRREFALQNSDAHRRAKPSDAICDPIVDYSVSIEDFDFIGINTNFQEKISFLGARQILFLVQRTRATHLMEIQVAAEALTPICQKLDHDHKDPPPLQVNVVLLKPDSNLKKLTSISQQSMHVTIKNNDHPRLNLIAAVMARMTANAMELLNANSSFKPNSVKSHYESESYDILHVDESSFLPPVVSSMQFERIEHPDAYRTWDYSLTLFPATYFLLADQRITLIKNNTPPTSPDYLKNVRLRYGAACTYAVGEASLFSIIGTTYMGFGLGPCFFHNESTGRYHPDYIDFSTILELGHRVFINKNWFLGLTLEILYFDHPIIDDQNISINSTAKAAALLGYYVPNSEGIFGHLWKTIF